ncbi:MAG: NAD(+)/NADH kinase [Veillonellales bacterium]
MLTIGIFPNISKKNVGSVIDWMVGYCKKKKIAILLPEQTAKVLNYPDLSGTIEFMKDHIDVAITLGGDGTLLSTIRKIAPSGIPAFGINMGQLGFLTQAELSQAECALEKIIHGDYCVEKRVMLDALVVRNSKNIYVSSAVNDVVVTKAGFSRMIKLRLLVGGEPAADYWADGLIAATPTGSTGYSLSAGGPIVNPELDVMLLTPICPHTLHARPMIISADEEVTINLPIAQEDIVLTVDGQVIQKLLPGDEVRVRRSASQAQFLRFNDKSYYRSLRLKLWRDDLHANV